MEYTQTVEYIKALIASGDFTLVSGNCPLDEVKDADGHWADDISFNSLRKLRAGVFLLLQYLSRRREFWKGKIRKRYERLFTSRKRKILQQP